MSGISRKSQSEFAAGHPSSWSRWHTVWSDKEEGTDPVHTTICVCWFEQDGWCIQNQRLWSRKGAWSINHRQPDTGLFCFQKQLCFITLSFQNLTKGKNLSFFLFCHHGQARIDSHNKILYARHADQRNATFQKVLQMGNEFDRDVRAMLLRANLLKHEYHARASRKLWKIDDICFPYRQVTAYYEIRRCLGKFDLV